MNVMQLIEKLSKFDPEDQVLFTDGVNGEQGEQIDHLQCRRVFDNDADMGERRVVVIHGFDYGCAETFEFINAEHHGD